MSNALVLSKGNSLIATQTVAVNRYVIYFSLAVFGCLADLLSKFWVFQWRGMPRQGNEWWIWDGYVGIETALNDGALFGVGSGYSWLFAVLSIVAAVGILVWLFYFRAAQDRWLTVALGCVTGGIFGNLYDRMGLWERPDMPGVYRNEVRDWILFRYKQYTWPNFNIADVLLVCGAIMLMLHAFLLKSPDEPSETNTKTSHAAE